MHDGTTFFLEICRVADKDLLKAIKIENDVTALLMKSELKGFEIEKIEKHFPGTLPVDTCASPAGESLTATSRPSRLSSD